MRITPLASVLLPLLAIGGASAEELSTTICTSTTTLYKTITLKRVNTTTTTGWHNATSYHPTGTGAIHSTSVSSTFPTTAAPSATITGTSGAGTNLQDVGGALMAGVAGVVVAVLL